MAWAAVVAVLGSGWWVWVLAARLYHRRRGTEAERHHQYLRLAEAMRRAASR
jgi:hypothetical protein